MKKIITGFIALLWIACGVVGIYVLIDNIRYNSMDNSKSTLTTGPLQKNFTDKEQETINFKDVQITKLATYDITGVVLGHEFYYISNDPASKISQVDLELCWGKALENINGIGVSNQFNDRVAYFTVTGELYSKYGKEIYNYVSNNHLIPMNNHVESIIKKAEKGDVITMTGWLVECKADNWHWGPSSLVRDDHGCEIILVEYAKINKKAK